MDFKEFIVSIKNNEIKEKYLFLGDEDYLIKESLDLLKKIYIPERTEGMNILELNFEVNDIDDLRNSVETLPFLAEKKLTIAFNSDKLIENNEFKQIEKVLSDLGKHQILIILDNNKKLSSNTKFMKLFSKEEIVYFEKLKGKDLINWIYKKFKSYNRTITQQDISYLILQSGYTSKNLKLNLYDLENEIIKIVTYSDDTIIDKNTIDKSIIKLLDQNIFNLLTSIGEQNVERSLKIFSEIYLLDEPIIKIIYMINRQFKLQLAYRSYRRANYTDSEIISKLKIKPYEFNKISALSNRYTIDRLVKCIYLVIETEKNLKSKSVNERYELEKLIVNLANLN